MVRRILWTAVIVVLLVIGLVAGVRRQYLREYFTGLTHEIAILFGAPREVERPPPSVKVGETTLVSTGLMNFDMTDVKGSGPTGDLGGGLGLAPGGLLVVHDRDGSVQFYDWTGGTVSILRFQLPPLDLDALPKTGPDGKDFDNEFMRYLDIELFPQPGGVHVAVSYLHYDRGHACFAPRLAEAKLPDDWRLPLPDGATPRQLDWRILSEIKPCISATSNIVHSHQNGGRIVVETSSTLLITTGDFSNDGRFGSPHVTQLDDSGWGRVLRVNLNSAQVDEVARGLRNPQGLAYDSDGNLWATDHGAMGGDELDLIREGGNYGWPEVTLGTDYVVPRNDKRYWPLNSRQGRHDSYDPPAYAWMPSIAPSSIKLVTGLNERWDGDLLVATLVDETLHRLRMDGTRVVYDEPIRIGRRIRDLEIASETIYLLFDDGSLAKLVPHEIPPADGDQSVDLLGQSGCFECHSRSGAPQLDRALGPGSLHSRALRTAQPSRPKGENGPAKR
ncbi:MAG: PQQ-dependent sugar dehydrogenase [Devosia sp.]